MLKMNDDNEKDDSLNLSDMINEYEEDSVLRDKINALKAEKAQEEAKRLAQQEQSQEEPSTYSAFPSSIMDVPRNESVNSTFLDEEEMDEELDVDKTLVIMDNHAKRDVDGNESILYYDNHEVDAEEITEDDIQEFLGDEKVKKQRKPMDPKKMNKIITYVISGVVAVCILVGGGFGIKMAIDAFSNDDKSEPAKEDPTDKPIVVDPVDKPTDKPVEQPKENESNNAIKIAEINGTIKAKQQQVTDLNTAVANAKSEIERLTNEERTLNDDYAARNAEFSNITNKVNDAKAALQKEKDALAAGTGTQERVTAANTALENISTGLAPAEKAKNDAKTAYDNKQTEKNKKVTEKDGYVSQISSIQIEIDNHQKELQALQ